MAADKEAASLNDFVHAIRDRRRHQSNADKFFNKGRRSSAPGSRTQSPASGSLASRVEKPGVKKQGSAAAVGSARTKSANVGRTRESRMLSSHLSSRKQDIRQSKSDINIRGRASGPCIVIGSNFAPGTTAEDIESALKPVGKSMTGCRVLSSYPAVVAEMTFADQRGAEDVVNTFNDQKADGRTIQVYIKDAPEHERNGSAPTANPQVSAFDLMRELADRERLDNRRAEPNIQDGRYGFGDSQKQRRGNSKFANDGTGLYSDKMMIDEPNTRSQRNNRGNR